MPSDRKPDLVLRLNGFFLRLRTSWRAAFPFLVRPGPLKMVALETTTECTRNCAYCPPHSVMAVPKLRMSREIFDRVINSLAARKFAGDIFFSLYGDSLCDDRLESLLAGARAAVPSARLVVFTNGDLLTADRFLALKRAGMGVMFISVHDPEMRPELRATLAALRRDHPELYCVTPVDYYVQYYGRDGDVALLNNKGGLADVRRRPLRSCCDVESAAVDCLGNVLLCNNDATSSYVFGNLLEKDFFSIWENPAFAAARLKIMRGEWVYEICRRCMSAAGRTTPVPSGTDQRLPPAFPGFRGAGGGGSGA